MRNTVCPYTVRIRLKQPYVPLTGVLADRAGMVTSPAALKKYGKNSTSHPSCVGPFRFVERVGGDRIVLKKDPNYYDADKVHLDGVVYKPIPDGNVRLANLRSGDLQVGDRWAPSTYGAPSPNPGSSSSTRPRSATRASASTWARLPLPHPLPARHRAVPHRGARPSRTARRPAGLLPPRRRRRGTAPDATA
ncbi:ABC transporter substrate-binding protein [Streptomyces brevispora]|uniref:Extracellular solute-binding protein (Family 5) n=1 Tax=Streptomyces brevispora TaxID=887462 RepID=A0A561V576_9ACTN|nr:ABC transporter substrate-binding protein [Streptomyces brevispora]TWG06770.1 extracellular solute-binding protein (family 5) [Streptomyces brevispora]